MVFWGMTRKPRIRSADVTNDERDLILAGLFELTITYVEDDEKR